MKVTKKTVLVVIAATVVTGLVVTAGVGVVIVKLWPVARTWTQNALSSGDVAAARRMVAQVGTQLGDDRIVQLSRVGEGAVDLAALAGIPGAAEILKLTSAIPALGPLIQNGAYQKALEEVVRQNVPSIAQIRRDRVVAPEVRAVLLEVQQVVAKNPRAAEAASTVNSNVLTFLKSEAFTRLSQNPNFSRLLTAPQPAKEAE